MQRSAESVVFKQTVTCFTVTRIGSLLQLFYLCLIECNFLGNKDQIIFFRNSAGCTFWRLAPKHRYAYSENQNG